MNTTQRWLLGALVAFNLVLKCCWLGLDPLFNDEPFTVYWSQRPLGELWTMLATENNPPLYFLLIKAWSQFVPFDEVWLRVPAALCSAVAVVPLFLVARQFAGTRAALITGLIFSFSNYHYAYAHEVRAYALFTALACTSVWLLLRKPGARSWWSAITLGMVNTAMVYTHFFGWLMVGIQLLLVLLPLGLQLSPKRYLRALGITLVAFVPYGSLFALRLGQSVSNGTWLERPSPEELYNMLWRWSNAPVLVVLFVALVGWVGYKDRFTSPGLRLGLVWALVPLLGMYLVSFFVPLFLDRYLVYAAPGFALLVGLSINATMPASLSGHALASLPVIGMLATFTPWKPSERTPEQVVAQTETWCSAGCRLEIRPSWYRLNYAAAKDIQLLREMPDTAYSLHATDVTPLPVVVVDADADLEDPTRAWYATYRSGYQHVDSVQADRNVWVYRFRH